MPFLMHSARRAMAGKVKKKKEYLEQKIRRAEDTLDWQDSECSAHSENKSKPLKNNTQQMKEHTTNIQRFVGVGAILSVLTLTLGVIRSTFVLSNSRLEYHPFLKSTLLCSVTCGEMLNSILRFEISIMRGSEPAS